MLWKPTLPWVPSHNGFLLDWPQRQSAACGPDCMSSPLLSRTSTGPLTNRGPFFSAWIFTSAIDNLLIDVPLKLPLHRLHETGRCLGIGTFSDQGIDLGLFGTR